MGYSKLSKSQTGFTALHILLLLVLLGIIGFAGWKVYDVSKSVKPTASPTAVTSTQKPVASKIPDGFVEYENKKVGFTLAYPKEWKVVEEDNLDKHPADKGPAFFVTFGPENDDNVHISIYPSPNSRTVDMLLTDKISEATEVNETKVGGLKAARFIWRIKPDSAAYYFPNPFIGTEFENAKYYFGIYYEFKDSYTKYHNGDVPQKYIKEYDKIVESFKFNQ